MYLKNTNPLGEIDLPLIGKTLAPGEVFVVSDELGAALLEQVGNYEITDAPPVADVVTDTAPAGIETA